MSSEQRLIERVGRAFSCRAPGDLHVGIGDDAAVIRASRSADWVITTDAFIENVHFHFRGHPPKDAGYKALARATSDLAAKGAQPRFFLMNLALSRAGTGKWLDDFLAGMSEAARRFGLVLIGGDTTRSEYVAVNLTVLGSIAPGRSVLRSGARPGDAIFVSGTLGEATLGLRLMTLPSASRTRWKPLLQRHLRPEPRLKLGQALTRGGSASAMIDISDGLSTDLTHVCEASAVGARIYASQIPKVEVPPGLSRLKIDALQLALHGGDDYELLFTVPKRHADKVARAFRREPVRMIGSITREKKIVLVDAAGKSSPLTSQGWDPFR
jgi:thiamine-monophosphate kinase